MVVVWWGLAHALQEARSTSGWCRLAVVVPCFAKVWWGLVHKTEAPVGGVAWLRWCHVLPGSGARITGGQKCQWVVSPDRGAVVGAGA